MYGAAFGNAVKERREHLCMSQEEMSSRMKELDPEGKGRSSKTISDVEVGLAHNPRGKTLRLFDSVLGWPEGTSRRILETGQADLPSEDNDVSRRLGEVEAAVRRIREVLSSL